MSVRKPAPKLNQNDLRRLMKEKQRMKGGSKRIDSPLAKYNNLEQLFCILCNTQIKNELVWPAHVSGKVHKENLDIFKSKKQEAEDNSKFKQPLPPPPPPPSSLPPPLSKPVKSILKRKTEDPDTSSKEKKLRVGYTIDKGLPADLDNSASGSSSSLLTSSASSNASSAPPSSSLLTMCERDEEMNEFDAEKLPADFFDNNADTDDSKDNSQIEDEASNHLNSVEALPEGFFDDPIIDAKVRKVEYKDPVEEEWEKFQREIADATTKAQAIIDEEEEESTAERQIDEIEEQIRNWARVDVLQRRKEELDVQHKEANGKNLNDDEYIMDEQEFDEFLDWRSKDSWQ